MPRYFFDIDDGAEQHVDDVGTDLPDEEAARDEATETLVQMAKDSLPRDGMRRTMKLVVRHYDGRPFLHVTLAFAVEPVAASD